MIERHLARWAQRRGQRGHLGEEAMLEVLMTRRDATAEASRHTAHVAACQQCEAAVSRMATRLDGAATAAQYIADEMIGADRLARQHEVIDRRLDGQPGRLLHFPVHVRAPRTQPRARRWVAMAAACGLVFGLAAGRLIGPPPTDAAQAGTWVAGTPAHDTTRPALEPALADEHLLVEVDAVLARTLHREFRVLDELTPRTADVRRPAGR